MKQTTFRVDYPADLRHPMHARIMETTDVSRAELLMWGPTAEVTTLCWYDGPKSDVRTILDAVEPVTTSLVTSVEGTYAFVEQRAFEFDDSVMAVVADASVVFLPPVVFEASGTVEFEAVGDASGLSRLYDDLRALGDVTIAQVSAFDRVRSNARLTSRQRAALEAAHSVGYYEVPRTGSVEDIADELDCAHSTAGELLRRAEAAALVPYAR
ncbi:helix-turn-helix domain-containing protein [Halomicroarcula sp. F13]|uniref:Helix-turn-helix domain-containing protein n=1 Tax=Haloarcula rubra TaxID=2487747 RepID=A0AAW4PSY3_9EURY|nr:helix-turn-helix domain-containing protein [Halomicroarcula rubra]MBX0324291.1 helix-turn-helix domain-containing protein [Halomicroarcula rubra]